MGTEAIKFGFFLSKKLSGVVSGKSLIVLFATLNWNFNNYPHHNYALLLGFLVIVKGSAITSLKIHYYHCDLNLCKYICNPKWSVLYAVWNSEVCSYLHLHRSFMVQYNWLTEILIPAYKLLCNPAMVLCVPMDPTAACAGRQPARCTLHCFSAFWEISA